MLQYTQKVKDNIKISVIVPVYNVEQYLVRCISSIQRQLHKNIEIILVDDGSDDNSGEICDRLAIQDSRIVVIHQENRGLSDARNTGLNAAQGDYIGFVDSDDWIAKDFYENLLRLALKYDADIVTSSYVRTSGMKTRIRIKKEKVQLLDNDSAMEFYLSSAIRGGITDVSCWSKLFRKSIIANTRFPTGRMYEDVIFNWKLINGIKRYVTTNYIGYYYFKNPDSLTSYSFSPKFLDLFYVADELQKNYKGNDSNIKLLLNQYSAKADYSILVRILKSKKCCNKVLGYKVIKNTKLNCGILMKSPLSFGRKCVLVLIKLTPSIIIYKLIRGQR